MPMKTRDLLPTPSVVPPKDWDQRPDETPWMWSLFWAYLNMPIPRSCERLAGTTVMSSGKPRKAPGVRNLKELSRTKEWVRRVSAWDIHINNVGKSLVLAETIDAQQKAAKRHADAGTALQEAGLLPINVAILRMRRLNEKHLKAVNRGDWAEAEKLEKQLAEDATIAEAGRLVKDGVNLERLGLGMPTANASVESKASGSVVHTVEGSVHVSGNVTHTHNIRAVLAALPKADLDQLYRIAESIEAGGLERSNTH